jgi:hypothetical protein
MHHVDSVERPTRQLGKFKSNAESIKLSPTLIDTGPIVAMRNQSDPFHAAAQPCFKKFRHHC